MSQYLRVTDSIDHQKWEDFVLNHTNGNIFQTPEMHEVYRRTKNYEPIALAVLDESNEIVALTQAVVPGHCGRRFQRLNCKFIYDVTSKGAERKPLQNTSTC